MPHASLSKEAQMRLKGADEHFEEVREWLEEVMSFTMPRKLDKTADRARTDEEVILLYTSIGIDVTNDFASDMAQAFMPREVEWVDLEPGTAIPPEQNKEIKDKIKALKKRIFKEIAASNFYDRTNPAWKDIGVSTGGMFIQDIHPLLPVDCQHIPGHQLRIQTGPRGGIDDRFWCRKVFWKDIPSLLPGAALSNKQKDKIEKKPLDRVKIAQGGWRDWSKPEFLFTPRWQWVDMIENDVVNGRMLDGTGIMPILIGRWDPSSESPWGTGPGYNALADMRSLDELKGDLLENIHKAVNPPMLYPEDGVINPRDGVSAGDWLPSMPGSGRDIQPLFKGADIDAGFFGEDHFERIIRRHFFQDEPVQRGKTPPTLGQWLDEAQRIQQRIGGPAAPLWSEYIFEIFLRFNRILTNRNEVAPVSLSDGKVVNLVPVNPIQRSQKQEDVLLATRLLEIGQQFFPDILPAIVNAPETLKQIKEALGDDLVELEDADQAQIIQLLQNAIGGLQEGRQAA